MARARVVGATRRRGPCRSRGWTPCCEAVRGGTCPRLGRAMAKVTVVAVRQLLSFLYAVEEIERPLVDAVRRSLAFGSQGFRSGSRRHRSSASWMRAIAARSRGGGTTRSCCCSHVWGSASGKRRGCCWMTSIGDRASSVRGKGRAHRLPLPDNVGDAIAAYLRDGRPATAETRAVFVTVLPPARALGRGGVCEVVVRAASGWGWG